MNISLERLIEGIIATLRADVIPNVPDGYARGQAVGVIDLLNNIGPRVEWAREPALAAVAEKRELLRRIGELLPQLPAPDVGGDDAVPSTAELLAERDRLDAAIADALVPIHGLQPSGEAATRDEAQRLLKQHMHDELARETKLTRKPLFAEIASGAGRKAAT
jgi:hypothetical protein